MSCHAMESASGLGSWIVPSWTVSGVAARAYDAGDDVSNEHEAHEERTALVLLRKVGEVNMPAWDCEHCAQPKLLTDRTIVFPL